MKMDELEWEKSKEKMQLLGNSEQLLLTENYHKDTNKSLSLWDAYKS